MIKVVLVDCCTVEDVKCDHLRRIKVTILIKFFFINLREWFTFDRDK